MESWVTENVGFIGVGKFGAIQAARIAELRGVKSVGIGFEDDLHSVKLPTDRKLVVTSDVDTKEDMQNGELVAEEWQLKIKQFIITNYRNCSNFVILAGAGGGFGCGSILVVAEAIKMLLEERGVGNAQDRTGIVLYMPNNEVASENSRKNAGYIATALHDVAKAGFVNPYIVVPWKDNFDSSSNFVVDLIEKNGEFISVMFVRYPHDEVVKQPRLSRLANPPVAETNIPTAKKKNIYGE